MTTKCNMVTTIKITCDGVFIQTNSNRIHTVDDGIVTDSSMNVINDTNGRISNGHINGSSNSITNSNNKSSHSRNKVSGEITKRSIPVDDIVDFAPLSLPNLPITNSQPALISPQLVKTLSRIKKTTATANSNKTVINSLSSSSVALSSVSVNKSIHKVIRIDKNGQCTTKPITSDARQWDGCIGKKNGIVSNGSAVRRRNTFKNYLIECKENIVRRLSSPTSPIG